MSTFIVVYDIPPALGACHIEVESETEQDVRVAMANEQPFWRILKVIPLPAPKNED